MADVHGLEFALSDGKRVWFEARDLRHAIERSDDRALVYRQISRDSAGRFTITKAYATDPERNTLLIDVTVSGAPGATLYVLYHPALKNSGYGNSGSTVAGGGAGPGGGPTPAPAGGGGCGGRERRGCGGGRR